MKLWSSLCPWSTAKEAGRDLKGRAEAVRELDRGEQGRRRGVWPSLDPGQARAGASAGGPAQSGPAGGGDVGSIDQTGAPPPLPVRPRWGPWAGGAAAARPAIGREGQAGWPGSREPRRRGRRGAGRSSLQPGPLRSAQPAPRKLSGRRTGSPEPCAPESW